LTKPELRPFPGQEPKRDKADITVFDRCNITRRVKLFDEELPPTVEERPERQTYTLKHRKRRPRPFLSPTGEVVLRLRGGRGFTPIYAPWNPVGLARVRGTLVVSAVPSADGGRSMLWSPYAQFWAAEKPGQGPYILRAVLRINEDVQVDIGPRLDEGELLLDPEIRPEFCAERGKGWKPAMARNIHDLELEANKLKGKPCRVRTSEYRNEAGEYGPETKLARDGRVVFGRGGLAVLNRAGVSTSDIKGYESKRRVMMKNGRMRTVDGQQSPDRRKPGRKPVHGFALSARLRKAKQRCKERGLPFVIERYVKEKEPA
jgi:hypothetical protein